MARNKKDDRSATADEPPNALPTHTKESYGRLTAEARAMLPRLDPRVVAEIAAANAVRLAPFRDRIVAAFGDPAGELVDELGPAAREVLQADTNDLPPHDREAALQTLVAIHEGLRRIIIYVRWHRGDADAIVHPLWPDQSPSPRSMVFDLDPSRWPN